MEGCCSDEGGCACSCHHELEMARIYGMLGSVDANTGDAQTGKFFFKLTLILSTIDVNWLLVIDCAICSCASLLCT